MSLNIRFHASSGGPGGFKQAPGGLQEQFPPMFAQIHARGDLVLTKKPKTFTTMDTTTIEVSAKRFSSLRRLGEGLQVFDLTFGLTTPKSPYHQNLR